MRTIILIFMAMLIVGCEDQTQQRRQAQAQTQYQTQDPQAVGYEDAQPTSYEPKVAFHGKTTTGYDLYMASLKEEYDRMDRDMFPVTFTLIGKHLDTYAAQKEKEQHVITPLPDEEK